MERTAACLREVGNWSKLQAEHKFDNPVFSPEAVLRDLEYAAPKLKALLDTIARIDREDMEREGRVYKHFIYSDLKSSYGAKLIASGLAAMGFHHAYGVAKGARGMSFRIDPAVLRGDAGVRQRSFAVLTSVSFFDKNVGVNFRKELLRVFNARPDNIYGENIRIMVLDSGFREGVDLFDVRYAHLFEPIATLADEKQAVGRITRYCGQKGLDFHPTEGWPVQVYRYETLLPKPIYKMLYAQLPTLEPARNFFDLFLKYSSIDPKKIQFANELAEVSVRAAVDSVLTESIHSFKIKRSPQSAGDRSAASSGSRSSSAARAPGAHHARFQERIQERFKRYTWPPIKIENGCTGAPIGLPSVESRASSGTSATSGTRMDSAKSKASWYSAAVSGAESTTAGGAESTAVGGANILPFTPTQDFIRHYFTPSFKHSGMLLWHSVGTGKTCTAIATASSSFENEGYTILYVTRYTLKGDVWKNMFDQVCSVILQERIQKHGLTLPDAQAARLRLLEKRWIEPMSYRQFSNMLDGKSKAGEELRKRNGAADPLRKTLVIIDEAHKLFAPDVAGSEKPDMDVITAAFDRSRAVSGADGAKILFMTATPYTSQPMDLIRLLNLLRPVAKKFPEDFEAFAAAYLDDSGRFTPEGKLRYWDEITGYISYLNREKDLRTFSYPVFHEVQVPMTNYEFETLIQDVKLQRLQFVEARDTYEQGMKTNMQTVRELEQSYQKRMKTFAAPYLLQHEDCTDTLKVDYIQEVKKHKDAMKKDIAECRKTPDECLVELKKTYEADKKAIEAAIDAAKPAQEGGAPKAKPEAKQAKPEAKQAKPAKPKKVKKDTDYTKAKAGDTAEVKALRKQLIKLKHDFDFDTDQCKKAHKTIIDTCVQLTQEEHEADIAAIPQPDLTACDGILETLREKQADEEGRHTRAKDALVEQHKKTEAFDRSRMEQAKKTLEFLQTQFDGLLQGDRSQRLRLEKCLGLKPAYQRIMHDDAKLMNVEIESGPAFDEGLETALDNEEIKKNLFLVLGHGSERVESVGVRQRMPKDKILIVFPVCSRPNYMNNACKFIHEYAKKEHRKLFADPLRNRDRIMQLIQQPMHVYLPGERVPNLSTDLFLIFKKPEDITVFKSGVFRIGHFPEINHSRLPLGKYNLGSPLCSPYIGKIASENHYNKAVHHEMTKGNVFKPVQEKKGFADSQAATYHLQDIMAEVGPGIYYYIGCRSGTVVSMELYERILAKSEEQQKAPGRSQRLTDLEKILLARGADAEGDGEGIRTPSVEKSPSPILSPPSIETVLRDMKKIEKHIQQTQADFLKRHHSARETDTDAYDDLIVQWANQLETLRTKPVKEFSQEEKERAIRKAILQGVKKPTFTTQEDLKKVQMAAHGELEFLAYLRTHPDDFTTVPKVSSVAKSYKLFSRDAVYTFAAPVAPTAPVPAPEAEKKGKKAKTANPVGKMYKLTVSMEPLGCLPATMEDKSIKCSSERLSKYLLDLMKKGVPLDDVSLPKTPGEWKKLNDLETAMLFQQICGEVRGLIENLHA